MREKFGKTKLVQTAALLFAQKGYHATSVEQIAKAAGVSKGLMYNYFNSKTDLLGAIIEEASSKIFAVASKSNSKQPYQVTLRVFLDHYLQMITQNKDFLSFQLSLLLQVDLKTIVQPLLQIRVDHIILKTEMMFKDAGVRNHKQVARRFITELDGVAMHELSVINSFPVEELIEDIYNNYKGLGR